MGRREFGRWLNRKSPEREGDLAPNTDSSHSRYIFWPLVNMVSWRASLSLVKWMGKIRRQHCKAWGNLWGGKPHFQVFPTSVLCPFQLFGCLSSLSSFSCPTFYQTPGSSRCHPARLVNIPHSLTFKIYPCILLLWSDRRAPAETSALAGWLCHYPSCDHWPVSFLWPQFAIYKVWGLYQAISKVPSSLNSPWFDSTVLLPAPHHWMEYAFKCI